MTSINPIAVLTGDLIKSRSVPASALDGAIMALRDAATDFGTSWNIGLRFTRHRGDGWQVILTKPNLTFDAMLFLIARLRGTLPRIDTRIAAGIGAADTLGSNDLSDASGEAFFTSGNGLDSISRKRKLAIGGAGITDSERAIIDLTEFITDGWTTTQAEAMAFAMGNYPQTHEDIAAKLGITRQAVQSRLAGAGLAYFDTAIGTFRHHEFISVPQD